jgi:hypothetical protein
MNFEKELLFRTEGNFFHAMPGITEKKEVWWG